MALKAISRKLLGAIALLLALSVAACGSSSTGAGGNPTATSAPACTVSTSDLQPSSSGSPTAPTKDPAATGSLTISGSTALQPLFQKAQPLFDGANGTKTTVDGGGSGTGLSAVESGSVKIGMSDLFAQEKSATAYNDLVDHQVATVVFTLVVSSDIGSSVKGLTTQQIKDIFTGTDTNWSQVGGPNEAINVIVRSSGSGTRFTFDKYVLGSTTGTDSPSGAAADSSTGQLITDVGSKPGSIGYVTTGFVLSSTNANVVPLCIDGAKPTLTDINAGTYKFWSYEHAYTKGQPTGTAKAFLDYVTSTAFAPALPASGFVASDQITNQANIAAHKPAGS
jgi:phosphate transport system substrate-binding protein